jgi:hypothetical protein
MSLAENAPELLRRGRNAAIGGPEGDEKPKYAVCL